MAPDSSPTKTVSIERLSVSLMRSIGVAMGAVMFLLWLQGQGDKIVEKLETSQEKSDAKNESNFRSLQTQITAVTSQVTTLGVQVDRIEDKVGEGFVTERELDGWVLRANARIEAAGIQAGKLLVLPKLTE